MQFFILDSCFLVIMVFSFYNFFYFWMLADICCHFDTFNSLIPLVRHYIAIFYTRFLFFCAYGISFYHFFYFWELADICFVLISILLITYTRFFLSSITSFILKSEESEEKVVDLGCKRHFHFYKLMQSTKKRHFNALHIA